MTGLGRVGGKEGRAQPGRLLGGGGLAPCRFVGPRRVQGPCVIRAHSRRGAGHPEVAAPGGLTPPAALEFRLCRSKTRAACLQDEGLRVKEVTLPVGVGVRFRATGQYASVQLVHFPQPVRRTPDSDRGAGRAASNGQTA